MTPAPWFEESVAQPGASRHFEADGARLHLLTWNWEQGRAAHKPAVLLVHGFQAHVHWWDTIAPWLAKDFRVAALDLSGMGDSEARPAYGSHRFARDVLAAITHLSLAPATVVGHSYGGSSTLLASALAPEAIAHAIVVDTYYNFLGEPPPGSPEPRTQRVFGSAEDALARYRLVPSHPYVRPWLLEHVARHSLKRIGDGWAWKFDPGLSIREEEDGAAILARVGARVDYIHAECSDLVDAKRASRIVKALPAGNTARPIVMKGVGHHVPLEDPVALRELLHALLVRPVCIGEGGARVLSV